MFALALCLVALASVHANPTTLAPGVVVVAEVVEASGYIPSVDSESNVVPVGVEALPAPVSGVAPAVGAAAPPVAIGVEDVVNEHSPDLGLDESIEKSQKLLISLDIQVKKLIPVDLEQEKVNTVIPQSGEVISVPVISSDAVVPQQYAGAVASVEELIKPVPGIEASSIPAGPLPESYEEIKERQINQISSLLDQIDRVEKRLSQTIDSLADRRRYILSNGLRPVLGYVQRVQSDLVTLNKRLTGGSGVASSAVSAAAAKQGGSSSGATVDQTALDAIRNTVNDINKTISDMIVRIRNAFNFPTLSLFSSTTGRPAI